MGRKWLFLWWFEVELGGDYYVFVNMHEREREKIIDRFRERRMKETVIVSILVMMT